MHQPDLQPPARGIQWLSKWQLYLGKEKQHISKNGSISKQNQKRPEQVFIVDFVNTLFLKEYTEIYWCTVVVMYVREDYSG